MKARWVFWLLSAASLLLPACAKRNVVEVPPRVDLYSYDMIGVVQFASTENQRKLAALATQRFVEALQESQPGVKVLELGTSEDIQRRLEHDGMDFETVRALGEQYGVGAVVLGTLEVQDVQPRLDLHSMLANGTVSADVKAGLTTKLMDAAHGATVWTRSSRTTATVAQVGMSGGAVRFDAQDPEQAYGRMIDALIGDLTQDFRVTYVKR